MFLEGNMTPREMALKWAERVAHLWAAPDIVREFFADEYRGEDPEKAARMRAALRAARKAELDPWAIVPDGGPRDTAAVRNAACAAVRAIRIVGRMTDDPDDLVHGRAAVDEVMKYSARALYFEKVERFAAEFGREPLTNEEWESFGDSYRTEMDADWLRAYAR